MYKLECVQWTKQNGKSIINQGVNNKLALCLIDNKFWVWLKKLKVTLIEQRDMNDMDSIWFLNIISKAIKYAYRLIQKGLWLIKLHISISIKYGNGGISFTDNFIASLNCL